MVVYGTYQQCVWSRCYADSMYKYYSNNIGKTVTVTTKDGVRYKVTILRCDGKYGEDIYVYLDVTDPIRIAVKRGLIDIGKGYRVKKATLKLELLAQCHTSDPRYSYQDCYCIDGLIASKYPIGSGRSFSAIIYGWTDKKVSSNRNRDIYRGSDWERTVNKNCGEYRYFAGSMPTELTIEKEYTGGVSGGESGGGGNNGGGNGGGNEGGESLIVLLIRLLRAIFRAIFGGDSKSYKLPNGKTLIIDNKPEVLYISKGKFVILGNDQNWKKGFHLVDVHVRGYHILVKLPACLI